jgi:hypothetical protein
MGAKHRKPALQKVLIHGPMWSTEAEILRNLYHFQDKTNREVGLSSDIPQLKQIKIPKLKKGSGLYIEKYKKYFNSDV